MILLILFTPEAIRCIKISRFPTSGMEWNVKLQSTKHFVIHVKESKKSINIQSDYYSH
jgi:hypothetical protein